MLQSFTEPEVARSPFFLKTQGAHALLQQVSLNSFISDGALRPVRGPGYSHLHVSSQGDRRQAAHMFQWYNPCPLENVGLKGVPLSRYQRGLVPRWYREALCVVSAHRARSGAGNRVTPR